METGRSFKKIYRIFMSFLYQNHPQFSGGLKKLRISLRDYIKNCIHSIKKARILAESEENGQD